MKLKKAVSLLLVIVMIAATTTSMSSCGAIFNALLDVNNDAPEETDIFDLITNNNAPVVDQPTDKTDNDSVLEVIPSTEGLDFELNEDGQGYTLIGIGECKADNIVISHYNGKPVTDIASRALKDCTNVTELTVCGTVKSIGFAAFIGCNKITKITVPYIHMVKNGAGKQVGLFEYFFGGDGNSFDSISYVPTSLAEVTVLSGHIYVRTFSGYHNLKSVTLCEGVTSIDEAAFHNCDKLTSVTISNTVTSIGMEAFEYCEELKTITIPDSVKGIDIYAFNGCTSLTSITIGSGMTNIGAMAFDKCSALKTVNYTGSAYQWNKINGVSNIPLEATINYNYGK